MHRLARGLPGRQDDRVVGRCLVIIFIFSLLCLPVRRPDADPRRREPRDRPPRARSYGLLYACFGLGAVIGALSIGTVLAGRRLETRRARRARSAFAVVPRGVLASLRRPAPAYPGDPARRLRLLRRDHVAVDGAAAAPRRLRPGPGHGALDHGLRRHGPHRRPHRRAAHRRPRRSPPSCSSARSSPSALAVYADLERTPTVPTRAAAYAD